MEVVKGTPKGEVTVAEVHIEKSPWTGKPLVAIDIETTDTLVTAGVWDIAVVAIIPTQGTEAILLSYSRTFKPGGTSSASTLEWLRGKREVNERYKQALTSTRTQKDIPGFLRTAFDGISKKAGLDITERGSCVMISWGSFDFPIMKHVLEARHGLNAGDFWHYGNECDLRAVAVFNESELYPEGVTHNALQDACAVLELYPRLKEEQRAQK